MDNSVSRQDEPNLALSIPAVSCQKHLSESYFINPLIDQACSVEMAGYSPRFPLLVYRSSLCLSP